MSHGRDREWKERIAKISVLYSQYSDEVHPNSRIRLVSDEEMQQQQFRGTAEGLSGRVVEVRREENGIVNFTADMADGTRLELSNADFRQPWELVSDTDDDGVEATAGVEADTPFRSALASVDKQMAEMTAHVDKLDAKLDDITQTYNAALRAFADDIDRGYRGQKPEFATRYAAAYDKAEGEKESAPDTRHTFDAAAPPMYYAELESVASEPNGAP